METVASPPEPNTVELRLLTAWGEEGDRHRRREAGFISILFHIVAVIGLAVMPSNFLAGPRPAAVARRTITPLVAPLSEPTQITPNKGPLSKEFDAEALRPRPRIQVPPFAPFHQPRPGATRLHSVAAPPYLHRFWRNRPALIQGCARHLPPCLRSRRSRRLRKSSPWRSPPCNWRIPPNPCPRPPCPAEGCWEAATRFRMPFAAPPAAAPAAALQWAT